MAVVREPDVIVYYFFRPYEPKQISAKRVEPFEADTVLPWMEDCADNSGIPMFRTRLRGNKAIFYDGRPAVYGICWGDRGNKVPSVLFRDVPSSLWLAMSASSGDWEKVLRYFRDHGVPGDEVRRVEMKIRKAEMLWFGP